jgi:hypothetical protein
MLESWAPEQLRGFERDGFLIVDDGYIDDSVRSHGDRAGGRSAWLDAPVLPEAGHRA